MRDPCRFTWPVWLLAPLPCCEIRIRLILSKFDGIFTTYFDILRSRICAKLYLGLSFKDIKD